MSTSLPGQYARTRGFTLGSPRAFAVAPDGQRVAFLRSRGGDDPAMCLWVLDVSGGVERLIADPGVLLGEGAEEPPPQERADRERVREVATGVTGYASDRAVRLVAFALSGRLWVADLGTGRTRELPATAPVVAPRPDPAGSAVAYVSGRSLRAIGVDGSGDRELAGPEGPAVSYGLPEYVAAESMGRDRGYWWSPDGSRVLAARADTTAVQRWHITDPSDPSARPVEIAYPAAGTPNANVTLWVIDLDGGGCIAVDWDRAGFEYVVAAHWGLRELAIVVQSRDQKTIRVLTADLRTGATRVRREDTDPCWVQIVPGVPAFTNSGAIVWTADSAETRRLLVDDKAVTPPGLQVREVFCVDGETVLFAASGEPAEIGLWTYSAHGGLRQIAGPPGVHQGRQAGGTTVIVSESLEHDGARVIVRRGGRPDANIASHAETPVLTPRAELWRAGRRELRTAVLLPSWHAPGTGRLPVLMDPYGGPGGQRVLAALGRYVVSQWFADQGFAVVVADGRGTPGRGPAWERVIYGDRGLLALEDQVSALHAAAERYPDLDLDRVGIRGWSFGGYLAAMAVLRRPDVFHAAAAGAPVTDQRLYNTHWNERYLGHPDDNPEAYDQSSLLTDAPQLRRPLMLIHGLADDNVVAAHTLLLSSALTAAGRPHTALLLPGVTHMTVQHAVAENLLALQAGFFKHALRGRDAIMISGQAAT
jgi:dipeptidyl-peptidase 4